MPANVGRASIGRRSRLNYSSAHAYRAVAPLLEPFYQREWLWPVRSVLGKCLYSIDCLVLRRRLSSVRTWPHRRGKKSDLVLNLCREAGKPYLPVARGRDYLTSPVFQMPDQRRVPELYPRSHTHRDLKNSSRRWVSVDLLFNSPSQGFALAATTEPLMALSIALRARN